MTWGPHEHPRRFSGNLGYPSQANNVVETQKSYNAISAHSAHAGIPPLACSPKTPPDLCKVHQTKRMASEGTVYRRSEHCPSWWLLCNRLPGCGLSRNRKLARILLMDVGVTGSARWRFTNTNPSMAAWSRLTQSGWGYWKTRTASWKSYWQRFFWNFGLPRSTKLFLRLTGQKSAPIPLIS